MIGVTVMLHGDGWYFGAYPKKCPECNSNNISRDMKFIGRGEDVKNMGYRCCNCSCEWLQTREDGENLK